jgi:hypothetical protein
MSKENTLSIWGVGVGGIALLMALISFWAGPFAPQASMETSIGEAAAKIRQSALDSLAGRESEKTPTYRKYDIDDFIDIGTAALGGIAVLLAALAFAKHESARSAGSAAALGVGAIAFQFIAMYAFALLFVILIAAVISDLGGP